MDVAVFKTLKAAWKEERANWTLQNMNIDLGRLRRSSFCPLLQAVIQKSVTAQILKNGFRKCGLLPWDFHAIDLSKLPSRAAEEGDCNNVSHVNTWVKDLENAIGVEKMKLFRKPGDQWRGAKEDTSLSASAIC